MENTFRRRWEKKRIECEKRDSAGPVRLLSVSLHASLGRQCALSCVPLPQNKNTACRKFRSLVLLRVATTWRVRVRGGAGVVPEATTWIKLYIRERVGAYRSEHPPPSASQVGWEEELQVQLPLASLIETRRTGFAPYRPPSTLLYQHFHFVFCVISGASVP